MITKITINNFKKIEKISFEINTPLVLIGPNNSGKTSILQAITLWEAGLKKWAANKTKGGKNNGKQQGVSINRKDLISLPVPSAKLLWHDLKTHAATKKNGKPVTDYVFLDIMVEGVENGEKWIGAFEFYYANEESFYCRPLRKQDGSDERYDISVHAHKTRVAYLQPMSGLAASEDRLTPGSIDRKIGEGKTADVIRNISWQLLHPERAMDDMPEQEIIDRWKEIVSVIKSKFGITIQEPKFYPDNGLLDMTYIENGIEYDLSNAGRGFQQTLLLLCFLYSNPGRVILMDEPDAHLEVLRQKEMYALISEITRKLGSQLIIASHSEIVLREAALKEDDIIAIIQNTAFKLNDQRIIKNFRKSLTDLGWDKYYLAKLKKHCFFLEGTTDIANLEAFAEVLKHPVKGLIEMANVDPVEGNIPGEAFNRYNAIKLIEPDLKGLCLFDRIGRNKNSDDPMPVLEWSKRELENYFCTPEILIRWAFSMANSLLTSNYPEIMTSCISDYTAPQYLKNRQDRWWLDEKLGDWAENIFREFSIRTSQPLVMRKSNFHELVYFLKPEEIDREIGEKLDAIYSVIKPD
jgi:ABC-type Mn2+/Zn2+ transport system ATPase subunit